MAFSLFIISTFFFSYVVNNVDVEQCIAVLVIDLGLGTQNKGFGFWKCHKVCDGHSKEIQYIIPPRI